jgi:dTMP kinase
MGRYPLIAIEGCDYTGKTTLVEGLVDNIYQDNRLMPIKIQFPTFSSSIGRILIGYIQKHVELSDVTAHHLFSANRWEEKATIEGFTRIQPVIVDRYVASGSAYTVAKGTLTLDWCDQFNGGLPKPDITIYLDCDVEALARRRGFGADRFETIQFQKQVKQQFELVKQSETEVNWHTFDVTTLTNEQTLEQVYPVIKSLINDHRHNNYPLSYY